MNSKDTPPSTPPEPHKPAEAPSHAKKESRGARPLRVLTVLILIGAMVVGLYYFLHRNLESTDDAFIDGHIVQVSPRVAAHVNVVRFNDNQEVRKGDLLLELDPRDFEVAAQRAQAQLLQAQAQSEQARAQATQAKAQAMQTQSQFKQAQAQASQQSAQFEIARVNYERNASLFHKDMRAVSKEQVDTTKATFDAAKASFDAANANVESARATQKAAEAQASAAEAQAGAAEAAVRVAETALENAKLQLSYTKVYAAESGRITRKSVEPGNYVQPGQTLSSIVQHDVWVTANFKETQLNRMRVGQPVSVRVDAYPGKRLRAHVDSIQMGTGSRFSLLPAENATGNFVKVVQRVPVKIVFEEAPEVLEHLAPGMSVEPEVNLAGEPRR